MRVDLAYPYEGHAADATIEVDDATGRRMIREGRARAAQAPVPDEKWTVKALQQYATDNDIPLGSARFKVDVLSAIQSRVTPASANDKEVTG